MTKMMPRMMLLALLLASVIGCARKGGDPPSNDEEKQEPGSVNARTAPAEERTIVESISGLGRCESLPGRQASLTAALEGRVARLLVRPGERVTPGKAIVQLDPAAALANLEEKKAARDSLVASLNLLVSLPRPEEQATAKLAIDQAKLGVEKAQATVDRLKPLRERNEIPEQQLYEAELALKQAQLQLETAQAQYDVLMLKPRPQAIEEAKSKVTAADAAIATAKAQIDLLTIASPIDGVLDSLNCRLGQTLPIGTAVGEVVDAKELYAVTWLAVPEARRVHVGQVAEVRPADAATGKVVSIGQAADPQTGNLPVRILLDNQQQHFLLGQVVSTTIIVGQKKTLAVPVAAVEDVGEGPVISVVRDGKSAILKPTLGMKDRQWIEVLGTDLKPGEPVIVEGGYNLPEGTLVNSDSGPKADKTEADQKEEQSPPARPASLKDGDGKADDRTAAHSAATRPIPGGP